MNGDLTLLLIGAIIGIIGSILGSILGYCVNHLLNIRERRILREYEIREKGREFYHQIYGIVAVLSDFVTSFLQGDDDKTMVLIEKGYALLPKKDVIKRYKEEYERFSRRWYKSRGKGLEVFISKKVADSLEKFWGFAGYFYEKDDWSEDKEIIERFREISQQICDEMDKQLGIS